MMERAILRSRRHALRHPGNHALINSLRDRGALQTKPIIDAFEEIRRIDFVLPEYRDIAYYDEALPIRFHQSISQPYTVAFMLECLEPAPGEKILDIGAGSGWTTALLAAVVGTSGSVRGIELVPELVEFGKHNLAKYDFPQAEIVRSGAALGDIDHAPYDKILVSASSGSVPQELMDQLRIGGTMVVPVNDAVWRIKKISVSDMEIDQFEGFVFVPLRR